MSASDNTKLSRRTVVKGASLVGATAFAAPTVLLKSHAASFTSFTASEAELLDAVLDRLIPADEHGPGAREARVIHYIDQALGDALSASRAAYSTGLAALDRYAQASRGKPFLQLAPIDQDSVLIDCELGGATGFTGSSAQFFSMLLNHARQGMFGDPSYGGNANFVGWDLLNYPGVRVAVSAADQQALEANKLKFVRQSASAMGFDREHHGD